MDFRTHSATTYPSSVQPKICYLCMSVKSVDTWSSGHTSKLNVLFTGLKEFVSKNCIVGVSVKISGHTDFWTHNKSETPKDSQTRAERAGTIWTYMFQTSGHMYFWTHSKKYILGLQREIFSIKALLVCLFKSVDTWTPGHTTKQCLSSVKSSGIYIIICFKSVDTWTFGHTAKNISLLKGIK